MTSYKEALEAFRRACDAWHDAGQPKSGPLLDELGAARVSGWSWRSLPTTAELS